MTEIFLRKNSMDVVVMADSAAGQLKKLVTIQYVFPRWRVQHCALFSSSSIGSGSEMRYRHQVLRGTLLQT